MNEYEMRDTLRQEFAERLEDMRENPYWQDTIAEIADGFPSVYTLQRVDQWRTIGCPEVDDAGLIEGVTDIGQIIAIAVYGWASQFLYELARDADLD